jgi:hypothetical protein
MKAVHCCVVGTLLLALFCPPLQAAPQEVTRDEAARWIPWVIPMPREITLGRKVVVPAERIALTLAPDASPLERQAVAELAEVLGQKSEKVSNRSGATIEILLGTCGKDGKAMGRMVPGAERLFTLPNADQAYRIVPLDERTLALVGTHPQGVYYAAKTLKQLLSSTLAKSSGQTTTAIPLVEVTDWPDLAERGLWGGSANEDIEWMAERKMNLVESHVSLSVDKDGHGVAVIPEKLIAQTQQYGVKLVPLVTHLEQLPPNVLARFPELRATGDEKAWQRIGDVRPVCFSQPKAQELLTDWVTSLARYPEVTDINVWLSENDIPCQCDKCKAINPFVLQTQLALRAWEAAKQVKPSVRLRILLTQGSYKSNDQVLAAAPRDVGITYYDGGRTYDSSRNPMIYPLLEAYTAQGRWLGCYPQLTASWRIVCPWSGPQFIKARMTEFVQKRLQCLCGYATPSNRFYEFNVTAAAEWAWNANGRNEREFSLAWATRQGLSDPQKAADWAVLLGPVGWDVYGSRVPYAWVYGGVAHLLKSKPRLGTGVFTYFPTKEHFDEDLATCEQAMQLAKELQAPALIEETRTIGGLVQMIKGFYLMAEATAAGKKMTDADRRQAAAALALADQGSQEARQGLVAWGEAVAPRLSKLSGGSRYADTVNCVDRVMTEASDVATALGIPDPNRPYRVRTVGGWKTDDFKTEPSQKKTWEVSKFVTEPGRYRVAFYHDKGWYGLRIKQVRLVATPSEDLSQETELARDSHEGSAAYQPKNNTYELTIKEYAPKRRYFLVADIVGMPLNSPPERQGCEGHATMEKVRE